MDTFFLGKTFLRIKKEVAMCSLFLFFKLLAFIFFLEYNIYVEREKCYDTRKGVGRNRKISEKDQKY